MAELVANDALEFVAGERLDATARDGDGGVAGGVAGGEGVDAGLIVHDIDLWHGHAGGDGHFLDDVEQLAFIEVGGVGTDEASAERFSYGAAAAGERGNFIRAAEADDCEHARGHAEKNIRLPERELRLVVVVVCVAMGPGLHACEQHHRREIDRKDDASDGKCEINNEPLGVFAGAVLLLEEVHVANFK